VTIEQYLVVTLITTAFFLFVAFVAFHFAGWSSLKPSTKRPICSNCQWCRPGDTTDALMYMTPQRCAHPAHQQRTGDYITGFGTKMGRCEDFNSRGQCQRFDRKEAT
jgi:hypothetical protein